MCRFYALALSDSMGRVAGPNVRRENLVVFGTPRFYYLEHDQSTDDRGVAGE
jgi:hypothetical protein